MTAGVGCDRCRDLAAEVALGTAEVRDRDDLVAHVDHCPRCRRELRQLSDTADVLVALAPAVEPPVGFESRVLDRLGTDRAVPLRPEPRPRWGVRWAVAASVVVLTVTSGLVSWALGHSAAPPPTVAAGHVVVARLTADHRPVGHVVVQAAPDPWISMALALGTGDGRVRCELRTTDGRFVTVGWMRLVDGYGAWAAPVGEGTATTVDGVRVTDATGRVLAAAPLPVMALGPTPATPSRRPSDPA